MESGMEIKDMVTALSFGRVGQSTLVSINSIRGILKRASLATLMDLIILAVGGMTCETDAVHFPGQMGVCTKVNFKIMR